MTMMHTYLQNLYDAVPFSMDAVQNEAGWKAWRTTTRANLLKVLGLDPFPDQTPLNPRVVGTLDRTGYVIEKVVFETRPNFLMTANLYRRKDLAGRAPAVLCVHGHTKDGKTSGSEQIRAVNYARAGWIALVVDATGHGERTHIGHRRTWSIITTGMSVEGVQVWDNMRCVDYLLSRPEVDPKRIAISGCSGGGNQTMYTAAVDERLMCAVPVCSLSTLRGQIYTHNGIGCQCETIPNLMRYGLENAVVCGLIAPRALRNVSDERDPVFPIQYTRDAKKHIERFYAAIGYADRYTMAETRARQNFHGYHGLARREAHQWLDKWFNGRADEPTFVEPDTPQELAQDLFCFPGGDLPRDSATLASLAFALARKQVAQLSVPKTVESKSRLRTQIRDEVLGGWPERCPLDARDTAPVTRDGALRWGTTFTTEPGLLLNAIIDVPENAKGPVPCVVYVRVAERKEPWAQTPALLAKGVAVVELDVRSVGDDHDGFAAVAFGRPLVGMAAYDISRLIDYLSARPEIDTQRISLWAEDLAALPALYALALDERLAGGTLVGLLATYVSPTCIQQPMWTFASNLLKYADVEHLAGLVAPRPLTLVNPVGPNLAALDAQALAAALPAARAAYGPAGDLKVLAGDAPLP
jgi:cephalosporin-C deacetylase-like acetyl esterase